MIIFMNKSNLLLTILLAFIIQCLAAQDYIPVNDRDAFLQKLEIASASVKSIESSFVQEKSLSVLANQIISNGVFYFLRENNIRWEYTDPYYYLIIISNDKIFIKEASGQNQYDVRSNAMFREMSRFISGCIQGDILKQDKEYEISIMENTREFLVKLVPYSKSMRDMLSEVQITFDRKDMSVSGITMVEPGGDYTRISFHNKKLNTDIPLEKFSFK